MGILITVLVIFGLLLIARAALKNYRDEVHKNLDAQAPADNGEPLLIPEDGSSGGNLHCPGSHQPDPACADTHHGACDPGGHGIGDAGHGSFGGHH
ncbi:MAG TPA: hypothetical protein VMS18_27330 [Candidatus Binatia bacterium]|nr:hypothetical protein [Candidatus Binatia bacterium]